MKTFGEFLSEQNEEQRLIEAATLMAEKNIEPVRFLQKWFEENEPETSVLLEGFWDNVKQAGGQMWQGIKQGAQQFAANQFGPQAKFNTAFKALNDLQTYMQNDPSLAQTGQGLIKRIGRIVGELQKVQNYIPQMQSQTTSKWTQPNAPQNAQQQMNPWQRGMQNLQAQNAAGSGGSVPMPMAASA